ncbi:MAG: ABC transporter permease [Verrucomicrobia bacterium]|nr:ABC transporter permease [Verrucomicrobiota bacterium]
MTLIALMSVGVISLVVWLIILFLSVTDGIEKTWLQKLTSLNAPLRITPTQNYYSSYYYLSDSISSGSHYTARSLKEKLSGPSDPHDPHIDEAIPTYWPQPERSPDGSLRDPVKIAASLLSDLKKEQADLAFQDFEMSGAMLKLQLVRPAAGGGETYSFLTQASYLASFSDQSPFVKELISPPSMKDLNHLFFLCQYAPENQTGELGYNLSSFQKKSQDLLAQVDIKKLKTPSTWHVPFSLLPENTPVPATAVMKGNEIARFVVGSASKGTLKRVGPQLFWNNQEVFSFLPIYSSQEVVLQAQLVKSSITAAKKLEDLRFQVKGALQGIPLEGTIPWKEVEIAQADIKTTFNQTPMSQPFWVHGVNQKLVLPVFSSKERGILLSKQFQDNGIRIGDRGWLSYPAATAGALQEQRLPVFVSGFYDPGVLAIGNKCILAPANIVHLINTTSQVEHFDRTLSAGFAVWFKDIKKAPAIAKKLQDRLKEAGIDPYWKITTYKDYDFAKDLLQQFQSDRYLFTLIGLVILLVACSNVISFLVILVNDKKQEIGILQALGATRKSIAFIFGGLGAALGVISSLVGVGAAMLTLKNLDKLVQFLSFLQGHDAFNAVFYGSSLPHELSFQALLFVLIITPLLSLLAGLIPAWKACRLSPSAILRSE